VPLRTSPIGPATKGVPGDLEFDRKQIDLAEAFGRFEQHLEDSKVNLKETDAPAWVALAFDPKRTVHGQREGESCSRASTGPFVIPEQFSHQRRGADVLSVERVIPVTIYANLGDADYERGPGAYRDSIHCCERIAWRCIYSVDARLRECFGRSFGGAIRTMRWDENASDGHDLRGMLKVVRN